MTQPIKSVAVIGSGTMGAAIAALVANAGLPVLLLDIVPTQLTPEEKSKGLTLSNPAVRYRLVQAGLDRAKASRPPAFEDEAAVTRVEIGNLEDDFERLAEADWIIEVIVEKLAPKQALVTRIDAVRHPNSIISSNSSGLPMAAIAAGRSASFKQHFLGTHFFNPPRYMKLLEVIPTGDTAPTVVETIAGLAEKTLGKGVVLCKDTPNFIANRLYLMAGSFAATYAIEQGYSVAETDALTGPLLGRPKTGTFRLLDLIGVDVIFHIAHNLYDLIPHDPYRDILGAPGLNRVYEALVSRQWLGHKTGQGFYKQEVGPDGEKLFLTLNLESLVYTPRIEADFAAVKAVSSIADLGERLAALLAEQWRDDRGAQYVRSLLSYELAYAAACAQEIAHDLKSIDNAMRWGFNHQAGPFEMWDRLGVANGVSMIEAAGRNVAPWVKEMLAAGCENFYRVENGLVTGYYDWGSQQYISY